MNFVLRALRKRREIDPWIEHQTNNRPNRRFVGRVEGLAAGYWVGVALDEPVGKNGGSVKGVAYFSCAPGHGVFARPDKVAAGDFPPVEDFSDLGSEDEI